MPKVDLVLYRDADGTVQFLHWFGTLSPKARAKCRVRLERLAELGHELRRPEADYLRDGMHELRARHSGANYRMLYFFHGQTAAVLCHGFMKQRSSVPNREIDIALRRKAAFERAPQAHAYEEET